MGTYKPSQRISFLYDTADLGNTVAGSGGSQGAWVLRVVDIAPNATMSVLICLIVRVRIALGRMVVLNIFTN